MASYDNEFDDDPYRTRVMEDFNPGGGVVGPQDPGGYAPPKKSKKSFNDAVMKDWVRTGGKTTADRDAFFGDYDVDLVGEDKILANGRYYDAIHNVGSADARARTGYTTDPRFSSGAKSKSSKSKSSKVSSGGGGASAPAPSDFQNQLRAIIMAKLGEYSQAPSLSDPALAGQSQAYRVARERAAQQERGAMAERAAAQGLLQGGASSGAFDTTVQGIQENAGQDIAGHDASLLGAEVQQRRAALQSMLSMAVASGDAESARALQVQLANLDAQLRREAMKLQSSQFNQSLGFQRDQLGQQRYMYDDTMGFNISRANTDDEYRRAILAAFGGA